MLQFSLRNLLIAVAAVAVGTAALLNANEWWASLVWGVVLSLLVFAGLVALFRREAQRAFWSGYLVAGTFYLMILMFADGTFLPLNRSHLITTRVIVWAYSAFPASKTSPFLPSPAPSAGGSSGGMPGGSGPGMPGGGLPGMPGMGGMPPGMGMAPPATPNPSYIDGNDFMQVGHALWMLVLSWLSGIVAFCLYRTREKSSTAGASARTTPSRLHYLPFS